MSLSDLPDDATNPVFEALLNKHKVTPSYQRRFGKNYIQNRRVIEDQLRERFIAKGGRPRRAHPFYFILGQSAWFKNLNAGHQEIKINIASLDPATTSITYPDSFIALTQESRPYHGQVYLLNELEGLVMQHGLPDNDNKVPYERYWETDFELYIEFQLWEEPEALLKPVR